VTDSTGVPHTITVERAIELADHASPMPQEASAALRVLRDRIHELERGAAAPGWQWVPVQPTEAMIQACIDTWQARLREKAANGTLMCGGNPRKSFTENYAAMLAAAPVQTGRG